MIRITIKCLLIVMLASFTTTVTGQDPLQKFKSFRRDFGQKIQTHFSKPHTGRDNAMEQLAREIDWLENYLDEYGSVVVKQPDIWGESRLTKYRRETEETLAAKRSAFALRTQAKISRSDLSEFSSVTAIDALGSSAIDDFNAEQQNYETSQRDALQLYDRQYQSYLEAMRKYNEQIGTPQQPQPPASPITLTPPKKPSPSAFGLPDELAKLVPGDITAPQGDRPSGLTAAEIEPTIELNQLKRYLDHLNQLRRVNEGDDTSDAPGYALNLVRIPVSILPGRATRRGYGAEVTITAKPIKSPNLLPSTFRNLAINDLVDQLSLPTLRIAEQNELAIAMFIQEHHKIARALQAGFQSIDIGAIDSEETLKTTLRDIICHAVYLATGDDQLNFSTRLAIVLQFTDDLRKQFEAAKHKDTPKLVEAFNITKNLFLDDDDVSTDYLNPDFSSLAAYIRTDKRSAEFKADRTAEQQELLTDALYSKPEFAEVPAEAIELTLDTIQLHESAEFTDRWDEANHDTEFSNKLLGVFQKNKKSLDDFKNQIADDFQNAANQQAKADATALRGHVSNVQGIIGSVLSQLPDVSSSRSQNSSFPISTVITRDAFGLFSLISIADELKKNYKGRHVVWNESSNYKNQIHLLDAKRFLRAYFDTAYNVLAEPAIRPYLIAAVEGNAATRPLAELVTLGATAELETVRQSFRVSLTANKVHPRIADFCWCMVVEMAMLNKRLNEDVYEQAVKKGDCQCKPNCYHMYYLPMPKCSAQDIKDVDPNFAAAADEFCNYVACRWPIHVFTIDPVHQEQNISDASLVRRELSIAAALAFTNGQINLNQLTRFQRQFQEDIATIDLNRTQTGFMHSNDVFGWRFSPRVQARKSQGNFQAFGETLFGRGADANWRDAKLEPGMRECTAIVLMPSFVPYCDFDTRTNWFQINKPTHSDISMKETMKLSRAVTKMRSSVANCAQCEHLYRPEDKERLFNRVEQLEREIPLQVLRTQIPYENTLGGFDLFNNGLTDLGPRLEGWYGAPGIVIGFNKEDDTKRTAKRPDKTTLFLVAHNLSVNQTSVIAGGIKIDDFLPISREVIQVTIPDDAQLVEVESKKYVAVTIATPYGTTNHMHIPVVTAGLESASAKSIADLKKELLKKIQETPYKWARKSTPDLEISFCKQDDSCNFSVPSLVQTQGEFELKTSNLDFDLKHDDRRKFSIVAVIKTAAGTSVGKPVLMVANQQFNGSSKVFKASDLYSKAVLSRIQDIKSAMFKGENTLKLKIQTYIVFYNDPAGMNARSSNPIQIGGDLEATVIPNNNCQKVIVNPAAVPAPAPAAATPAATTTHFQQPGSVLDRTASAQQNWHAQGSPNVHQTSSSRFVQPGTGVQYPSSRRGNLHGQPQNSGSFPKVDHTEFQQLQPRGQ